MVQCDRPAKYGRLKFKINYLELFAKMQSWYCVYTAMVFSEIEVTSEKKSQFACDRDPFLSSPLTHFEDKPKNIAFH